MKKIHYWEESNYLAVTIPMTVRVEGVDHSPFEGVKVYAFDGATYKGYSGTSGKDGQVTFTLPQGNYRFRGDLNGTQFWSGVENHCALPGCSSAIITLPGGNTSSSSVTINYTYDGLSRLTAADYSSGDFYHYAYDAVGNRLTETTAKGETAYTYDPANRLTSVNGQAVQWDDNGNMLADGQAVYKYNAANKLVGVTKGTSSIVYAYSGLGDRLKQIADGVTTDYTLDINAGLTQVLQDNTNKYVYGNSRIAQIAETQTGYFLPDALGSMRQMTDSSADLTLARAYDPYGNVVSSSGAGETVYGYTGEMQSGGLVHLRARDYAAQLGRFTSRDTWVGNENQPISYEKYVYSNNNPVIYIDPSGMLSCRDNSDELGECNVIAKKLNSMADDLKDRVMRGKQEPVSAFVALATQAAIDFRETEGVMWGLTNILLGMDPNIQSTRIWMLGLPGQGLRESLHVLPDANPYYVGQDWLPYKMGGISTISNQGDWNPEYFDSTSNQAFHFWYYVAMKYYAIPVIESNLPDVINKLHDPYQLEECLGPDLSNLGKIPFSGAILPLIPEYLTHGTSRQDFNLSINGMALGSQLKSTELADPFSIPNWIYSNLKNLYYERSTWGKEGEE